MIRRLKTLTKLNLLRFIKITLQSLDATRHLCISTNAEMPVTARKADAITCAMILMEVTVVLATRAATRRVKKERVQVAELYHVNSCATHLDALRKPL
jgi:hypothetical protein